MIVLQVTNVRKEERSDYMCSSTEVTLKNTVGGGDLFTVAC